VRPLEQEDMAEVTRWITSRGVGESVTSVLPMHGYIVEGKCACFIYLAENAPVCFIEWIVSNPDISARESVRGINELAGGLKDLCESLAESGVRAFTVLSNKNLVKIFNRHGFETGCDGETTMVFGGSYGS